MGGGFLKVTPCENRFKDWLRLKDFFAKTTIATKYTPEERRRLILSRFLSGVIY
ncbi:MAG: hypothetical protein IJ849_05700 [Selenomonadaceae bacterium]|nr:hypothetical protein [Selenomonadaceae bacterium]